MGLGADVVLTPRDPSENLLRLPASAGRRGQGPGSRGGAAARARDERPGRRARRGPQSAVDSGVVSPDGEVALIRIQYPGRADLSPADLEHLKTTLDDLRDSTALRIEAGGDLYFAFEQAPTGVGEALGLAVAIVILLLAFGSIVAMGLPIGTALLGLAVGAGSLSLVAYVVDIPSWAVVIGSMIGLGRRHRLLALHPDPLPRVPRRRPRRRGRGRPLPGHRWPVGRLRRRHGRRGDPGPGRRPDPVHHRRRHRHLPGRAGDGARLHHPAAGAAGDRGPPGQRAPLRPRQDTSGLRWRRWGAHVGRHATAYAIGATVLLLALAAPVTALRLGFPDEGTMPQSRTERRAYDLIADGFGPGANGPAGHRGRRAAGPVLMG